MLTVVEIGARDEKEPEEVRAPEALADFPNVAEVAQSIHGVKTN